MVTLLNYSKFKSYKPTTAMELEYLEHNAKFISLEIQELEEKIILLMKNMLTKNILLQVDKYKKQILIYNHQLSEIKKQINKWKI
jgi:hypothetical protein